MKRKTWLIGAISVITSITIIQVFIETGPVTNTILAVIGILCAFIVLKMEIFMFLGDEMKHIKEGSDPTEELFKEAIQIKYAVSKLLIRIMCCIMLIVAGYSLLVRLNARLFTEGATFWNVDSFAEGASFQWAIILPVMIMLIGAVELYHTFGLFVNDKRVFLRLLPSGLQRSMRPFLPMRHHAVDAFIEWENISDVKIKRSLPFGTKNIIVTASAQTGTKTKTRTHKIKVLYSEQSAEEIMQAMESHMKPVA